MNRFEVIEHTADVGLAVHGKDLKEALANIAYGMFSLIIDLDKVEEREFREVEVYADDREELVVAWLNELLYLFDTEFLLLIRFEVKELDSRHLRAQVYGEKADPLRHELKTSIKAATYHMLKVEENSETRLQVIFDL